MTALAIAGAGAAFAQFHAHPSSSVTRVWVAIPHSAAVAAKAETADRAPMPRTWLGVSTRPLQPLTSRQLGIGNGVGLEVMFVAPESPAAKAGLAAQDVLVRFGEQVLVNQEQLAVLVRNKKPGDEVELTLYRGGKEKRLKSKLARSEHVDRPVLDGDKIRNRDRFQRPDFPRVPGHRPWDRKDWDRMFDERFEFPEEIKDKIRDALDFEVDIDIKPGKGFRQKSFSIRNHTHMLSNEQGSVTVTSKNGKRHVVVEDAKGNTTYEGDFKSLKDLPEDVRDRLAPLNLDDDAPAEPETEDTPETDAGKRTEI